MTIIAKTFQAPLFTCIYCVCSDLDEKERNNGKNTDRE